MVPGTTARPSPRPPCFLVIELSSCQKRSTKRGNSSGLIPRPPSEYWRRQMYATFQIDRTGLENLARIGAETLMEVEGSEDPVLTTWRYGLGRVTALTVDPRCKPQECTLYVGAAGGGVWRSKNALAPKPSWK